MKFGKPKVAKFIKKFIEDHPERLLADNDFYDEESDEDDFKDAERRKSDFDEDLLRLSSNPKLKQSTNSLASVSDYVGGGRLSSLLTVNVPTSKARSGRATPRQRHGSTSSRRASFGNASQASAFLKEIAYGDSRLLMR